ncbi:MAG: hypothetical protein WC758_04285 [Candidatus Woesearchaeota archaeon]|jgi:hypothetical protein
MGEKIVLSAEGNVTASINPNNGQLVSLILGTTELLHGGGKSDSDSSKTAQDRTGPQYSEFIAFPVVGYNGAVNERNIVGFGRSASFPVGENGLAPSLAVKNIQQISKNQAVVSYSYKSFKKIENLENHFESANLDAQVPSTLYLPFSFDIKKTFKLERKLEVEIELTNHDSSSASSFGYALGWTLFFRQSVTPQHGFVRLNENSSESVHHLWFTDLLKNKKEGKLKLITDAAGTEVYYYNGGDGVKFDLLSSMPDVGINAFSNGSFSLTPLTKLYEGDGKINLGPDYSYKHTLKPGETHKYRIVVDAKLKDYIQL